MTRTITRTSFVLLTAALFAAAIHFGELEFITTALLTGTAGSGVDVRQTAQLARTRPVATVPGTWPPVSSGE